MHSSAGAGPASGSSTDLQVDLDKKLANMSADLVELKSSSSPPNDATAPRKENYLEKRLRRAVAAFDRDQVNRLLSALEEGTAVINNKIRGQRTPLHLLCDSFSEMAKESSKIAVDEAAISCREMVQVLLEHGADVTVVDDAGASAIHYAARSHRFPSEALQAMMSECRDPNLTDSNGATPLHYACRVEYSDLSFERVQLLLDAGCSLTHANSANLTPIDELVNVVQSANESFLALPSRSAFGDIIDLIVSTFPELALKFKDTFLWPAVLGSSLETVKFLFENDAKADENCKMVSDFPLILAAGLSAKDADLKFALLLERELDPHVKGAKGANVCHAAAQQGNIKILEKAKELGVDLHLTDVNEATILHKAARGGSKAFKTLNFLVENGFDVHAKNKLNQTPLYMALTAKNEKGCALLVSASSSIDLSSEQLGGLHYEQLCLLSNPEPIIDCQDPLLVCLQICRAFRKGARFSGAYKLDMEAEADSLEELAIEMVHSITAKSARNVLSTGLLTYAVSEEMKQFVASPVVQDYLEELWQGSLYTRKATSSSQMAKEVATNLAFVMIVPCVAEYRKVLHQSPLVAFWANFISYIIFIALLVIASIYNGEANREGLSAFDWLVFIFVIGFILQESSQFVRMKRNGKAVQYLKSGDNLFDVVLLITFVVYYLLLFVGFYSESVDSFQLIRVSYHLYGVAALGCCIRILSYLKIHRVLGPVQLSFLGMLKLFFTFLVMLIIFMLGFAVAISSIYSAVPHSPNPPANYSFPSEVDGFVSSFRTVFWTSLGGVEIEDFNADSNAETVVGSIVVLLWAIISDRILLGLLFGLVFSKFEEIQEHAEMEYKFARSEIILDFTFYPLMPVPFNVISLLFLPFCWKKSKKKTAETEFNRTGVEDMIKRYRKKMSKKESESSAEFLKVQKELASIQTKLDNLLKRKKKKMKSLKAPAKFLKRAFRKADRTDADEGMTAKNESEEEEVEEESTDDEEDSVGGEY